MPVERAPAIALAERVLRPIDACASLGLEVPTDISIVCLDHPDVLFGTRLFRYAPFRQEQRELVVGALSAAPRA